MVVDGHYRRHGEVGPGSGETGLVVFGAAESSELPRGSRRASSIDERLYIAIAKERETVEEAADEVVRIARQRADQVIQTARDDADGERRPQSTAAEASPSSSAPERTTSSRTSDPTRIPWSSTSAWSGDATRTTFWRANAKPPHRDIKPLRVLPVVGARDVSRAPVVTRADGEKRSLVRSAIGDIQSDHALNVREWLSIWGAGRFFRLLVGDTQCRSGPQTGANDFVRR